MRIKLSKFSGLLTVLLFLVGGGLRAQLNHFVYLQSDGYQPFYVKHNGKILSSSASGYLILSKLKDGIIDIMIGFPQLKQNEQKFQITVDKSEKGFLIKNFGEKGWGLFDLQSTTIAYAINPETAGLTTSTVTLKSADDPFANMLSTVTKDSTVKNVTVKKDTPKLVVVPVKPEVKIDTPILSHTETKPFIQNASPQKDTVSKAESPKPPSLPAATITSTDTPQQKQEEVKQQMAVQDPLWVAPPKTAVQQLRKFESREGVDCVFEVAETNGIKDTVRIFIAADSSMQKSEMQPAENETKKDSIPSAQPKNVEPVNEINKEEPTKIAVDTVQVKKEEIKQEPQTPPIQQPVVVAYEAKPAAIPNSNCKDNATEDDFLKLRKRMAAQNKEEAMVNEAKKVFKTKCFSTAQLKNLAVLFLTDEWRYRFYDAALPYVSDFGSFKSLGDTISEDYYKKRFQALLPNQ